MDVRLRQTACRQLRNITCAVSPLCALPRRHWLAPTPRPRFWRCGGCLVLPNCPPATSCTASCRQFASFHAAKAAHRELLLGELDCLPRAVDYCILMGTVMRDDTSQRSHRLAVTQPVVQPASSTRSPRTAVLDPSRGSVLRSHSKVMQGPCRPPRLRRAHHRHTSTPIFNIRKGVKWQNKAPMNGRERKSVANQARINM